MQRRRTRALRTAECHVFHADQSVACSIRDIMAARRWMRTSLLCSPTPGRDVCARGVDQSVGARRGVWLGGELSTGTRRRAQRRVRCEARRRRSWRGECAVKRDDGAAGATGHTAAEQHP